MYECLKYHCPNCGRTSQCLSQYQTSNSATERHESKLSLHECSCNKKFLKSQKWRRRYKKLFSLTSIPDGILFTFAHIVHFPSWMLILSIALLLVCCQGNHVQPAPTTAGSELHDVMVPVGTAFYYKIPDSAFHCDVEHLMVTGSNDRFLPGWLTYDSIERKLYGIPLNSDVGTNSFLLVAIVKGELNRGQICGSKTFEITVPPESDAVPIQLMSAALQSASIGEDGTVQFDNPNLHHRIVCFPGVHVTFASVIVNTDLNQLNGHQRIHILQHLALHLGLSVNKISTFSEQFPHPLISGLELPSVIAAGAGNGRFAKGIKTVFTWALGCGAIKVNETLITYLTKTSQDGTFSDKINHSIFGWHITSGIQKTLPKIRVRRAPLIGTHTPTTTVAMPTAVSVSRTTVFYNVSVSLSRVLPSASFSVTLAPINSSLPLPARTLSTAESSVEYISTMTSSASPPDVQTHTTLDIISSIMINTTNIASQVSTATSVASLTLSPSTLPVSQNILSPSRSASFETASLSRTPRISSVMDEITTSLIEPVSTIGPIVSASSAKTLEQSVDPMSSRAFSQTVQISSSASYTVELSTLQPTTVYQTSSIDLSSLKPSFISSGPIVSDTSLYSSPKTLEQTVHPTSSRSLNQTVQLSSGASYSVEPSTFLFATVYQTSLIDLTSLKPSFISSGPIVSDTSLHSSPKTLEESVHPTSSKALNQTIQISNDASYTVEPSTFLFTTVHQTSLIDLTSLKPSFISSTSIVSDTSLHSSPKTLKQSVLPTSGALNQTIQISSNASYSVEPSTFFSTTVYQTSLIDVTSLKPGSISSVPPSLTSTRTIYVSLTSSSEFISPSSNGTIEYETSSSFVASPGSSASSTSFTNQTGSSQSDAIILVSSSKATYIAMTPVLDTRSITQVIQPSSSVLLHQTKSSAFIPDLNSTESFTSTQPFNLTSSVTMTKSSEEVETTAVTPSSPLNSTDVFIPRTSSTAVYQPNKTDATLTTIETRSPTFMPQATTTVVTMPTRQNISSLQVSSTVPIAESISLMSSRVLVTVSHTESQGSTVLPSILPSVGNVSAVTSTTSTVIPTSIGPTLVPSTDPTIPPNDNPVRLNDIGRLEAKVGKVFRYVIPRDIFYDREDGDTRNLTLSCNFLLLGVLPSDYWLQFDSKRQELYGLPLPLDYEKYSGKEEYERYVLTARDSQGLAARDVFQVVMIVVTDAVTQQLGIRTSNNYTVFTNNVTQRLDLVERVKTYYGDKDMSAIRIVSVTQGSLVVTWTNDTLPSDQCDKKAVQQISSKVILSDGEVNPAFRNALEPEFPIQNAKEERFGVCNDTETFPTVPARGQRSTSETDMWLKHVLPGILVALLLIILALILVVYLRRRRPKPSNPEKKTYKKRKPIVLGEEIEMKTVPAEPLILPDDNFSCPPSYLSETSLDKPQHYDTDDEDEVDFANKSPSIRYEPPPPFYPTYDSPRDTPPPSYKLPPPYKF